MATLLCRGYAAFCWSVFQIPDPVDFAYVATAPCFLIGLSSCIQRYFNLHPFAPPPGNQTQLISLYREGKEIGWLARLINGALGDIYDISTTYPFPSISTKIRIQAGKASSDCILRSSHSGHIQDTSSLVTPTLRSGHIISNHSVQIILPSLKEANFQVKTKAGYKWVKTKTIKWEMFLFVWWSLNLKKNIGWWTNSLVWVLLLWIQCKNADWTWVLQDQFRHIWMYFSHICGSHTATVTYLSRCLQKVAFFLQLSVKLCLHTVSRPDSSDRKCPWRGNTNNRGCPVFGNMWKWHCEFVPKWPTLTEASVDQFKPGSKDLFCSFS